MADQTILLENQLLKVLVNPEEGSKSTLLEIYPLVKVSGVLGLEDFLEEYVEKYISPRLEALENGETGTLDDNYNTMNMSTLDKLDVIRGIWDETNQRVYC